MIPGGITTIQQDVSLQDIGYRIGQRKESVTASVAEAGPSPESNIHYVSALPLNSSQRPQSKSIPRFDRFVTVKLFSINV